VSDALGASAAGGDCTTHISVVDRHRNMVSLTHTAVSLFGSMVVVPGTGILLNNGMIWFNPEAGRPNSWRRQAALVNMVPVLGFRKGEPYLTLERRWRRIVSAIPQVIATLVDSGCDLQEAVEAPRLHARAPRCSSIRGSVRRRWRRSAGSASASLPGKRRTRL